MEHQAKSLDDTKTGYIMMDGGYTNWFIPTPTEINKLNLGLKTLNDADDKSYFNNDFEKRICGVSTQVVAGINYK